MSRYLVDTDWIIDALHGQIATVVLLDELAEDGLAISMISHGELYEGAYYAPANRTAHLAGLHAFLEGKELLSLTMAVMEQFGIVRGALSRQLRHQIGDMDLLIAATAMHHELVLLTRNLRDFQHLPGLLLYQPNQAT